MTRTNQAIELVVGMLSRHRRYAYALLLILGACYSPHSPVGSPCVDDSRCPKGQLCIQGICGGGSGTLIDAETFEDAPVDSAPDAPPVACNVAEDCANTNPCVTMACVDNKCVPSAKADGASCGATAAERCCSGVCVSINSDVKNCGGCGLKCAVGRTCEGVALTNTCGIAPQNTTGRCKCAGADAECPGGQICRTQTPYNNRCTPEAVNDCAPNEVLVDVNFCPNFCKYP